MTHFEDIFFTDSSPLCGEYLKLTPQVEDILARACSLLRDHVDEGGLYLEGEQTALSDLEDLYLHVKERLIP